MKRPFLILLSIAATAGFGTWLIRTPNTQREILLACAGWVLGFWAAAAIQSRSRARAAEDEAEEDQWDEEEAWDDDAAEDDDQDEDGDWEDWDEEDDR